MVAKRGTATIDLFDVMLSRSKGRDLSLRLQLPESGGSEILRVAIQHAERWRVVLLSMSPSLLTVLDGVKNRLGRLRSLRLQLDTPQLKPAEILGDCFLDAPELVQVSFSGISDLERMKFPWIQIEHFQDASVNPVGHIDDIRLIESMPRLVSYTAGSAQGPEDSLRVLTHQNIRHLSMKTVDGHDDAFDYLVLPNLSEIYLNGFASIGPLTSLVERSGCTITRLQLCFLPSGRKILTPEFTQFCATLSSLERLEISRQPCHYVLSLLNNRPQLFPRLKTLAVCHPAILPDSSNQRSPEMDELVKFLTTRLRTSTFEELLFFGNLRGLEGTALEFAQKRYAKFKAFRVGDRPLKVRFQPLITTLEEENRMWYPLKCRG